MDSDNFFFGIQAISVGTIDMFRLVSKHQLFWGFGLGFLVSTIVHAFLISDTPRHVPTMVLKDKAVSFEKIYPRDSDDAFKESFFQFSKNVDKLKITFMIAGVFIFIVSIITLLSF